MPTVEEMTTEEMKEFPHRDWNDSSIEFDSLVIIPGEEHELHDSGYRTMDFLAVKNDNPICLLSGCSDVIHLDGIGGYGKDWISKGRGIPTVVPPKGWSMDCLPKSGLLRLWCYGNKLTCGIAVSSFEVFSI